MRIALAFPPVFLLTPVLIAQGMAPEWELRDQVKSLVAQTRRFTPLLEQFDPQDWIAQGAPKLYLQQFDELKRDVRYVQEAAQGLASQPERLSRAFDLYERMQRLEARAPSIAEAVRRYQNPAAADLLLGLVNETAGSRETIRQYIRDLVQVRDAERDVLEKEAQKCRIAQTRTVAPPAKSKAGTKK